MVEHRSIIKFLTENAMDNKCIIRGLLCVGKLHHLIFKYNLVLQETLLNIFIITN